MLIDLECQRHGINKKELNSREIVFYESRKHFPDALKEWVKENVKCPVCLKNEQIELFKKQSNIPLRFKSCTFDNFDESKEKKLILDYANNFKTNLDLGTSLVLCGSTGLGKTHLSCALINKLIEQDLTKCIYAKAFDVLREVKDTYNKFCKYTFSDIQEKYTKTDLLVIDEVGVQFGSDTEKQILFEIINDRYENLKPTILVTNLSLGNLKEFVGDRVVDRMKENNGKIIIFTGNSFRGKNKNLTSLK